MRYWKIAPLALGAVLNMAPGLASRAAEPPPVSGDTAPAGRDILSNGGFEEGIEGWQPDKGMSLVKEKKFVHSGEASLLGEVTDPNKAAYLRRKVRVSANRLYQIRVWARATNFTKLVFFAIMPGAAATERTRLGDFDKLPAKWVAYDAVFTPEKDGEMELQIIAPSSFGKDGRPGKVWVDDIALYESIPPAVASLANKEGFNDEPAMARAADGSFFTAWIHFTKGTDSLRAARCRLNDGGAIERLAQWDVVPAGEKAYLLSPAMAVAGGGAAVVYSRETGENDWDVFAAMLGPDGAGKPSRVTRGGGIDIKPAAAWDGGALWIVWENNEGGRRRIKLSRWTEGKAGPVEEIDTGGGSNYEPSIAIIEGGVVVVAWHAFRDGNYDVFLRRRDAGGSWGPEARATRSAGIDRHARVAARGSELWIAYESVKLAAGYRIGGESARRLHVARVESGGGLMAPRGIDASPLAGRCEAANIAFDEQGRLWIAHLRPQGRRDGWGPFLLGYTGEAWTPLLRLATGLGLDRTPQIALAANTAFSAVVQHQDAMKQFNDEQQAAASDLGDVQLCALKLGDIAPAAAMKLEPLAEPADPFEPAALRKEYGDAAREPRSIEYNGAKLHLVFGDLHEHTDVSQCNRLGDQSIDESYQHMRDIASLDFAAATDHGYNITPYLWNYTAKLARVNCDPGRFLTFLGEEWTSTFEEYSDKHPYGFYGHRNLIFADACFPRWWNERNRQTPADLWADLRKMKADFIQIPHQLADTGNVPTDWNFVDETAQPVAEIFQVRGSYEYKGAPREAKNTVPKAGYFLQDAWARGAVIGVIASPDHGGGLGKACVFTPDLSRPAVLEALRQRHCFGTTAARMLLDVRVNGHLMGEKIPAAAGPVEIAVRAVCPAAIDIIEVCRNNEFVYTKPGGGAREIAFTFRDEKPAPGRAYYYVRLRQADDEIAWSSPVWIGYP